MNSKRVYLDNAATSWPKPESVYVAVDEYQRNCGAAAGRGAYSAAMEAERVCAQTRNRLAKLINAKTSGQIAFTLNGTDSLNQAIFGSITEGAHVITTDVEHNSVLRPLQYLASKGTIELSIVSASQTGQIDANLVENAVTERTQLIAVNHASNVVGTLSPLDSIREIAQKCGALFLVDAAQTLGKLRLDVRQMQCDLLCSSGHKGLLGPLGTGFMYIGDSLKEKLRPTRFGGTGSLSESLEQPTRLPDRFESGNLNVPGLVGLNAGLQYLESKTVESIRWNESWFVESLFTKLKQLDRLRFFGPIQASTNDSSTTHHVDSRTEGQLTPQSIRKEHDSKLPDWASQQMPILSFCVDGQNVQETASMLDQAFSVQVRAGYHCAARIHQRIGSTRSRGTVRVSPGPFNSLEEAEMVADAIAEVAQA